MKRLFLPLILFTLLLVPGEAQAQWTNENVFTVSDSAGQPLFSLAGHITEGDEYVSHENVLYRVTSVTGQSAIAERIGNEPMPDVSWLDAGAAQAVFASPDASIPAASTPGDGKKKLIAMYVTHSDESYVPSDGTQSIEGQGGIYDVARSFRDSLQKLGIDVILDESTHLPHDSGAYRRSRRTAERLLQKRPDAIIDIHRDGIPDPEQYKTKIDGENASQVRLLVGRGNQNSAVNREFAKEIKAVADKKYPGLIKDIFIGKGNYNQDLSPNAILLEFGTHTLSKERVLNSTDVMAEVVSTTLYGDATPSARAEADHQTEVKAKPSGEKDKRSMSSMVWLIVLLVVGALLFALLQTGGGKAMGDKLRRNASEITGGLLGKKHDKKE